MTTASHLLQSPINVLALREFMRQKLIQTLESSGGPMPKALVLDESLVGPLGTVAEYSFLKEHGVEKLYQLEATLETELRHVVYMIRPSVTIVKKIADHIRDDPSKRYFLTFIPRMTIICEQTLIAEGVMGNVNIQEFPMDLVPLDSDLLSMELPNAFADVALHGDSTPLYYAARSLVKLQVVYGVIPRISGKGKNAKLVADMVSRMMVEEDLREDDIPKEIDNVIILDRDVDKITPLCTQLTYEGLIDEILNIDYGFLSLPPALMPVDRNTVAPTRNTKIPLNSGDFVYEEIRDLNFTQVGPLLNKRAKKISERYEERHGAKSVKEIKTFITQLPGLQAEHQSLRIHTNIAEHIMEKTSNNKFLHSLEQEQMFISGVDTSIASAFIEDCINRLHPLSKVLRMMCLQSLANGGLKPKVLDQYRRDIIQTYGFEHLETMYNLEKVGLLSVTTEGFRYSNVRNLLKLVVDEVDEVNPEDIAYVYSGYAPLSVRLVQAFSQSPTPRNGESALKDITGPTFDYSNTVQPSNGQYRQSSITVGGQSIREQGKKKITLVYFLGGVTYAEVAAIRFLAKQSEGQQEYIIATTNMVKAESFLSPLFDSLPIPKKGFR
eukprot:CFRG5244T1